MAIFYNTTNLNRLFTADVGAGPRWFLTASFLFLLSGLFPVSMPAHAANYASTEPTDAEVEAAAANWDSNPKPPVKRGRENTVIESIDLRDITVGDAMRMLSEQTGKNIVASEKARGKKMALFLHHMRPMDIIDTIARTYNLWYQEDPDSHVVRIYTLDEFRLGLAGNSLRSETEIFTLRYPNAIDVAYAIRDLYYPRVVLDVGQMQMQDATNDLNQRFSRYRIMSSQQRSLGGGQGNAVGGAGGAGGTGGGGAAGGGGMGGGMQGGMGGGMQGGMGGGMQQGGAGGGLGMLGNMIPGMNMNTLQKDPSTSELLMGNQSEGEGALNEKMQQSSRIFVTVLRPQNRILVRSLDPEALKQIKELVKRLDMGISTVLLEVKIYSVDLSDNMTAAVNLYSIGGSLSTSMVPGAAAIGPAATAFGIAQSQGMVASLVSKNLQATLQLLETEGRLTVLATPLLVTSNQEVSSVNLTVQTPIVTGYTSSSNNSSGTNTGTTVSTALAQPILIPVTTVEQIGTVLMVTPSINADRSVSLRLLVSQSTAIPNGAQIPVPLTNTNGQSELVEANVTTVQQNAYTGAVVTKDRLAVAVGGMITESTQDTVNGIPLLMDIPWLGNLFKQTVKARSRKEMIIVLRPFIQSTPTEAAEENDNLMEKESLHPAADDFDKNLDLYKRPQERPNDYDLEPGHKLYPYQDDLKSP
jgi:general secretion pathway protein D